MALREWWISWTPHSPAFTRGDRLHEAEEQLRGLVDHTCTTRPAMSTETGSSRTFSSEGRTDNFACDFHTRLAGTTYTQAIRTSCEHALVPLHNGSASAYASS